MSIDEAQIIEWEKRYALGEMNSYRDAREMVAEIKRLRAALRIISGLDYIERPGDAVWMVRDKFKDALRLSRLALGLPKEGEPAILKEGSNPPAFKTPETGILNAIPKIPEEIPARGASPSQKLKASATSEF